MGGVVEMKAISFGDYEAKLLDGEFMCGWGCVKVYIESPLLVVFPVNGGFGVTI